MGLRRSVASTLLTIITTMAVTIGLAPTAGAAGIAGTNDMVALGDSFASGVGSRIYYADSGSCYRSPASYPVLAAGASGLALDFRACSGATVANVTTGQLAAVDAGTDYVTLTVGGNDVHFAPVLTECAKPSWWGNCDAAINAALTILRTQLPGRLSALYTQIRAQAPAARVVVTGYPLLFNGTDCNLLTFFSGAEMARLNAATVELDTLISTRTTAAGFTFADPRPAFAGHAWCDGGSYVNGLSSPILESYHPNTAGHQAYAGVVRPLLGVPAATRVSAPAGVSAGSGVQDLGAATFTAPDLGSAEARAAARAAGVSTFELAMLRAAQLRGVPAAALEALDRKISQRLGR